MTIREGMKIFIVAIVAKLVVNMRGEIGMEIFMVIVIADEYDRKCNDMSEGCDDKKMGYF